MSPTLQPLIDEPALLLKEKKLLVIADLHIGIENELREKWFTGAFTDQDNGRAIDLDCHNKYDQRYHPCLETLNIISLLQPSKNEPM